MEPAGTADRTGLDVAGLDSDRFEEILSPDARAFLAELHGRFEPARRALLAARAERQAAFDRGELPAFPAETADVRDGDWRVPPAPADLADRRVEITGPVDRKMTINALNSGARMFMADFEDSCSPTWFNLVDGQANMKDAVRRTISLTTADKEYRLNDRVATLLVRPRGWHLVGAARHGRRRADVGVDVRRGAVPVPQRRASWSRAAAGRTSTCPSWRGAPRRRSGTTSWPRARTCSAFRAGRCGRRC